MPPEVLYGYDKKQESTITEDTCRSPDRRCRVSKPTGWGTGSLTTSTAWQDPGEQLPPATPGPSAVRAILAEAARDALREGGL